MYICIVSPPASPKGCNICLNDVVTFSSFSILQTSQHISKFVEMSHDIDTKLSRLFPFFVFYFCNPLCTNRVCNPQTNRAPIGRTSVRFGLFNLEN